MSAPRYAASRQKACQHCSTAKAKCDRTTPRCARCAARRLSCAYPQLLPTDASAASSRHWSTPTILPAPERGLPAGADSQSATSESTQPMGAVRSTTTSPSTFAATDTSFGQPDFADPDLTPALELFCPIAADDIRNRWLNSYIPVPGQQVKEYPASITAFIYRILKSYAAVAVRGRRVPPFVHASQMTPASTSPPLSTCLTLVRICETLLPGSESVATDVLQREMNRLYDHHGTYDHVTLLAAFQAYLIYSLVLFFQLDQGSSPFLRQAMTNLQDLACSTSRQGLMCTAEQQRARPRWEAWVVAEAKRRTLFVMYLFDSLLLAQDSLPTFFGTELQGLPAPASQSLWKAHTCHEWEAAYNIHLASWVDGLRIDELWPIPADLHGSGLLERRRRVDQWLEDVDEFGTMLYAVTSCTHGG